MQKESIDFDRLRSANGLLLKWSARFGIDKNDFLKFCYKLKDDMKSKRDDLPVNLRPQFTKDFQKMLYASEIENDLIIQYTPMVHAIIRNYKVDAEQYEDLVSEGLVAVRCAIWHFRAHRNQASFTTFCHSSITKRIKWHRSKVFRKSSRRNKKCRMMLSVDLPRDLELSDIKFVVNDAHEEEISSSAIASLVAACKLSDQEKFLIESYIRRDDTIGCWYSEYNNKFTKKTRQGIHYQLGKVQMKLLRLMRRSNLLPEGYEINDRSVK